MYTHSDTFFLIQYILLLFWSPFFQYACTQLIAYFVFITLDPVTLFNGDIQMYNNSIVNNIFDDMNIFCKSTKGNGRLIFMSDIEAVNEYFANGDFEEPFVFSDFTNISVTVNSNYDISVDFIGVFDSSLSGEYGCYSEESGVMSKVLLTTGQYDTIYVCDYICI